MTCKLIYEQTPTHKGDTVDSLDNKEPTAADSLDNKEPTILDSRDFFS